MNKQETAEAIKVMQDFVGGEKIQQTSRAFQEAWTYQPEPVWQWAIYDYRTMPKPREFWIRQNPPNEKGVDDILTGRPMSCINGSEDYIHVREVDEDL